MRKLTFIGFASSCRWPYFGSVFFMLFFNLLSIIAVYPQQDDPSPLVFPTPKHITNMLFYLQRDPNINTVIYAINLEKSGKVNKSEPVSAYWIRYAENNEVKELNFIQRKFAYGITSKALGNDTFELRFTALRKQVLYLVRSATDQKYYVWTAVRDKKIKIKRLFIRIVGGSFWSPNVRYAQIEGTDLTSGQLIAERINIK